MAPAVRSESVLSQRTRRHTRCLALVAAAIADCITWYRLKEIVHLLKNVVINFDITDSGVSTGSLGLPVVRARFEPLRRSLFAPDWDCLRSVALAAAALKALVDVSRAGRTVSGYVGTLNFRL